MQLLPHERLPVVTKNSRCQTRNKMDSNYQTKMVKQWNVRKKKRPNIFMEYTTISGSEDTFSSKKKTKTATALKKKLSLGTPVAPTLKMAPDTSFVVGDQLQELHLLDVAKIVLSLVSYESSSSKLWNEWIMTARVV